MSDRLSKCDPRGHAKQQVFLCIMTFSGAQSGHERDPNPD
jgi:hypothetical protein